MDRDVWLIVMRVTRSLNSAAPALPRATFSDSLIVRLFILLAWRDLPRSRVRDRGVLLPWLRVRRLPSISQFNKRVNQPRFAQLLEVVRQRLMDAGVETPVLCIDGKPMPVGGHSADPDAANGRSSAGFCRGYRLHALTDDRGGVLEYRVTAMNVQEKVPATDLIAAAPRGRLLLADGNYDSDRLYRLADERGVELFTPLKGFAQSARGLRLMSDARKRAMRAWREHPRTCERLLDLRDAVERAFANLSNFGGGLG
ncbi:MAG: transposase, partial [Phycisphaerales bacterium]